MFLGTIHSDSCVNWNKGKMWSESAHNEPIILQEFAICQARKRFCFPKMIYSLRLNVRIIAAFI